MTFPATIQPYTPKVAVITGAAQGIGRAIALRLADDGLDVVLNDLPSQQAALDDLVTQIQTRGRRSVGYTGDVTNESDVQDLIEFAVKEMSGIDVVSFVLLTVFTFKLKELQDGRQCRYCS